MNSSVGRAGAGRPWSSLMASCPAGDPAHPTRVDAAELELARVQQQLTLGAIDVSLPGLDRKVAEELIHAAHDICPYSKATKGNIAVETNLV